MKVNKLKMSLASAITIFLASIAILHADENPFNQNNFSKSSLANEKLARGMCKNRMENMRGRGKWGGNWEGMRRENMPQGISPSMLPKPESAGAKALNKTCTQCHRLPSPRLHAAQEWPAVVNRMKMHMQWSGKWMSIDIPNDKELSVLLSYLQENAQVPIDKTAYSDLESASGRAFSQTCVQCHVLPDPKQHTADEWPTVVDRMFDHMTALSKEQPGEQETKMILEFLKENSSDS